MKNIIAYLQSAIRWLETRKSVETITAGLTQTVVDLESHIAIQAKLIETKGAEMVRIARERGEHLEEQAKASKVAQNIKALLG